MTNKKTKLEKFFTNFTKRFGLEDKIGSDSRSTPSPEDSTRELKELKEEKETDLTPFQKYLEFEKQNQENQKQFGNEDSESVRLKLNRPYAVEEYVVLLKDFPDEDLYRGYVCLILEISYDYSYPFEDNAAHDYQVVFRSYFDEKDPEKLLSSKPEILATISGRDLLRLETQDLRYRTSFQTMY
jgi:hypothetical protein